MLSIYEKQEVQELEEKGRFTKYLFLRILQRTFLKYNQNS